MVLEDIKGKPYYFTNHDLKRFILPVIIEQFLALLVGMSDSIMVATVGEHAVSGVSLVDNIFILLIYLFAALATGGSVVMGQYLGQRNGEKANQAVNQLILIGCWKIRNHNTVLSILCCLMQNGTGRIKQIVR